MWNNAWDSTRFRISRISSQVVDSALLSDEMHDLTQHQQCCYHIVKRPFVGFFLAPQGCFVYHGTPSKFALKEGILISWSSNDFQVPFNLRPCFFYLHSRFSSWEPHASRLGSVRSSAIFLDNINVILHARALHCKVYNKTQWLGQHGMALFYPLLLWYCSHCSLLSKAVLRWRTSKRMEGIWPP